MKKDLSYLKGVFTLALGELITAALVVLGFFLCNIAFDTGFSYRVFTGAALGAAVTVGNYLALIVSVNTQVEKYLALRGSQEMTDEEAEKFTQEHSMRIQNSMRVSYIVRTVTMLAALVAALLLDWFSPLAVAIPLLAYRPILTVSELIRRRNEPLPDPEKFIDYSNENEEEKESDE